MRDSFARRLNEIDYFVRPINIILFGYLFESGTLIGTTNQIIVFRIDLQTVFIGYEIFNGYWRKAYGSESVNATIECVFRDLSYIGSRRGSLKISRQLHY